MKPLELFFVIVAAELAAGWLRNVISRVRQLNKPADTVVYQGRKFISIGS